MKKKLLLSIGLVVMVTLQTNAQSNYDYSKLCREQLNRGVVAVKTGDGKVAVSWRTLKSDPKGQAYDIYRNGKKLNANPLKTGGTFFIDESAPAGGCHLRSTRRQEERLFHPQG